MILVLSSRLVLNISGVKQYYSLCNREKKEEALDHNLDGNVGLVTYRRGLMGVGDCCNEIDTFKSKMSRFKGLESSCYQW